MQAVHRVLAVLARGKKEVRHLVKWRFRVSRRALRFEGTDFAFFVPLFPFWPLSTHSTRPLAPASNTFDALSHPSFLYIGRPANIHLSSSSNQPRCPSRLPEASPDAFPGLLRRLFPPGMPPSLLSPHPHLPPPRRAPFPPPTYDHRSTPAKDRPVPKNAPVCTMKADNANHWYAASPPSPPILPAFRARAASS